MEDDYLEYEGFNLEVSHRQSREIDKLERENRELKERLSKIAEKSLAVELVEDLGELDKLFNEILTIAQENK